MKLLLIHEECIPSNYQNDIIYTDTFEMFTKISNAGLACGLFENKNTINDLNNDVTRILKCIDDYIDQVITEGDRHLFKISYHNEGGYVTEITQWVGMTALLEELEKAYEFEQIVMEKGFLYERVVKLFAANRAISLVYFGKNKHRHKALREKINDLVDYCIYGKRNRRVIEQIIIAATGIRIKGKAFFTKIRHLGMYKSNSADLGIMRSIGDERSAFFLNPIIRLLNERGKSYVIICPWEKICKFWHKKGFRVSSFERYISLVEIRKDIQRYISGMKQLLRGIDKLNSWVDNFDYSYLCCFYLIKILIEDSWYSVCSDHCSRKFTEYNRYRIVSIDVNTNFKHARAYMKNTKELNRKTLFTNNPPGVYGLKIPYENEPYKYLFDLLFVLEEDVGQKKQREVEEPIGVETFSGTLKILSKDETDSNIWEKRMSSADINDDNEKLRVLFAPTKIMDGFLSADAYMSVAETVLKVLQSKAVNVFVKFHPGEQLEVRNRLKKQFSDVLYISDNENIMDWFQRVDLVITNHSHAGILAAEEGLPVLRIIPQPFMNMVKNRDSMETFDDVSEVSKLLEKMVMDKNFFEVWREKAICKQSEWLKTRANYSNKELQYVNVLCDLIDKRKAVS